jgi:diguanylate cyclase (GGDEF)-like protein
MSGMAGLEITQKIQKLAPAISVIVMTAYAFIEMAIEAMEEGAYGYVSKPFKPAEIKIVLKRAIERYQFLYSSQEKKQFVELSIKDGLTGVYNRRFLDIFMTNKIATLKRSGDNFSLIMVDLDHFKNYNDTNGHQAGDQLLRKACELFQGSLRGEDMIFRYGGEEFVIYLDRANKNKAFLVAERIRNLVALYMPTTISGGISSFPEDGDQLSELVEKTDKALYRAKEGGRNRICQVEKA